MAYSARILKDSIGPNGIRIVTSELTYPRFVHSEFMTHRVLSRNAASSRAIPVKKLIARVQDDPVLPVWWGRNQAGMQAADELPPDDILVCKELWTQARDAMVKVVEKLAFKKEEGGLDLHKQIANRLLEPWVWITVIVTGTEFDNFYALRRHKDAQPEIKRIADLWHEAMGTSTPQLLKPGEWHLPLVDDYDKLMVEGFKIEDIVQICIGRCTRVSYLTHLGVRDPQADIELAAKLQTNGHMSPFEHAAMCLTTHETQWSGNLRGWLSFRKTLLGESVFQGNSQDD